MDHQIDPIGVVVKEFEVFVNDDQQDGHRLQVTPSEPHLFVLVRITCTGILKEAVAASDFTVYRFAHPIREMSVVLTQIRQ